MTQDTAEDAVASPQGGSRVGCIAMLVVLLLGIGLVAFVVMRERTGRRRFKRARKQIKALLIDAQSDCVKDIRAAWLEQLKDNPTVEDAKRKMPPARRSPVMSSGFSTSAAAHAEWGIKHLYADPEADFGKSSVSFNHKVTDISVWCVRGFTQTECELLVIEHGNFPSNAIFLDALRKQLKKRKIRYYETRGAHMSVEDVWKELARLAGERRSR